ncbi:MAG: hypoxanthine-guanine phosphoribosyltransferase [Gallionellaceae bacterium]|jgi:hypoxanthine phosphoribosyltransferase|nr:hypoxanthine-guanine phosphoribosyltransferase [Gallionellaceae bacterium]
MITEAAARAALQQAELICDTDEVCAAVAQLAHEINQKLGGAHPLVLSVMGGAAVFTGQLLPLLNFPLDFDYIHVSRYGNQEYGSALRWVVEPDEETVRGRVVLVLDDILDQGETLAAIKERIAVMGASACYCAVFAEKSSGELKAARADFVGLHLPDRFVFGFGMDYHGAWRNLPAIYAMKSTRGGY